MNYIQLTYESYLKKKINYHVWEQEHQSHKKIVILLHGICYNGDTYPDLIDFLINLNYIVYAPDLPGFGLSDGERGRISDFKEYADEIESFRREIIKKEGNQEIILIGHSLGALIILYYQLRYPDIIARNILAAPVLKSPLYETAKGNEAIELSLLDFCTDENRVKILTEEKKVEKRITYDLLQKMDNTYQYIKENYQENDKLKNTSFLFLQGEFDLVTEEKELKNFYKNINVKIKDIKTYPRMKHDIFNEKRNDNIFSDMLLLLDKTEYEYKPK